MTGSIRSWEAARAGSEGPRRPDEAHMIGKKTTEKEHLLDVADQCSITEMCFIRCPWKEKTG